MNLILLHGNGLSGIFNKISQIKRDFDSLSIREISSKEVSLNEVMVEMSSSDLFSDKRLLILEDFEDIDIEKFPDNPNLTVILRFSKNLGANSKILKEAEGKKAQVVLFSEREETNIFPFLDLLGDKNPKAYEAFEKFYSEWGGQYILTMIFYLFRRLVLPSKKAPSFVQQRLERQKRNFSKDEIKDLYKQALEMDFKVKSGLLDEKLGLSLLLNKIIPT